MVMYEVYISKFCSSKDNGIGDIAGIISKLDYFVDLGVDIIWITPFYPSPLVDNGYDISDYMNVDRRYGDLNDFKLLLSRAHDCGLKVVIDVVMNHTSDQHEWFVKSESKVTGYEDLYVWRNEPCNNWQSMFHQSAWSYSSVRGEYYLHRFAKQQPDLNYLNIDTLDRVIEMLKFWVDIGVDGFRFDVINFLISDDKLECNNPGDLHVNDINHQNTYDIIRKIRRVLTSYSRRELIYIGEVGSEDIDLLSSFVAADLMDYVFCFNIASINKLNFQSLVKIINDTYSKLQFPTIFFSSHDMARFKYRLSGGKESMYKSLLELMFSLPGLKIIYQGDEYGQNDFIPKTISEVVDVQAINMYSKLIEQGCTEVEAFKKALEVCRDFSRNMCAFEENQIFDYVKVLIKESQNLNDFKEIRYSDGILEIEYVDGNVKNIGVE